MAQMQANLSKTFVGLILLPIIGNAVEHITAITVAMKVRSSWQWLQICG